MGKKKKINFAVRLPLLSLLHNRYSLVTERDNKLVKIS